MTGPDTPGYASDQGVTPPVRGHIGEIRRSGHKGAHGRNRPKSDRTQRPRVTRMSKGNPYTLPSVLVPWRERERDGKLPGFYPPFPGQKSPFGDNTPMETFM
jgi:hypothetical protein